LTGFRGFWGKPVASEQLPDSVGGVMHLRSLDRDSFSEAYLTVAASGCAAPRQEATALYEQMAEVVAERGIQPVQEKIYGPIAEREQVLAAREAVLRNAGLEADLPCTYIDGRPGVTRDVTGLQLWGILPKPACGVSVATRRHGDSATGRMIRGSDFEILYLSHLIGGQGTGVRQADAMFQHAARALHEYGHSYRNVVRTWIYLDQILTWYDVFNQARSDFHANEGLDGRIGGRAFPASTAIQGRCGAEACRMDLLAVRPRDSLSVDIRPVLGSRRQPDAFLYGSGFSRAMSLGIEGRRTLFVSGTASIDLEGRTAHPGDSQGQALETLRSIEALLDEQGGRLHDIASGTLFHKDEETLVTYRAIALRVVFDVMRVF
jgi:enamine deaminase RidA (YjgF/YER057c/UK114 family)